jgi:uncharacterized hydrophobic protein (TIGR00271 family)
MENATRMNKLLNLISLSQGEENRKKVLENVSANISFRGANLWILACAIVIASIGLNVNSGAVIIGAMLISPLMGPIVGAGFAFGIYDFKLLRRSLRNLATATLVSLGVATIYFFITPFKEMQSELLARTAPNIYDILIAFFGGLVGVIAITRVEKGNPIPGVAIATALMPPLCTAGYGLAVWNWRFFAGALYLYTINCVFICIATFLIVKFLKYRSVQDVDERRTRQVRNTMTVLIMVLLLPGVYFAYRLYEERKFTGKVEAFIQSEFTDNGYAILYKKTTYNAAPKRIELAFAAKRFTEPELLGLNQKLKLYGLPATKLLIRQDTTDLKKDILNEISAAQAKQNQKDALISKLNRQLAENTVDDAAILTEAKILFPDIDNIATALHSYVFAKDSVPAVPISLCRTKKPLADTDREKLASWLTQKLKKGNVIVIEQVIRENGQKK